MIIVGWEKSADRIEITEISSVSRKSTSFIVKEHLESSVLLIYGERRMLLCYLCTKAGDLS